MFYGLASKRQLEECIRIACIELSTSTSDRAIFHMKRIACQETHFGSVRDRYEKEGRGPFQFDRVRYEDDRAYLLDRRPELNDICKSQFGIDFQGIDYGLVLDYSPLASCLFARISLSRIPSELPSMYHEKAQWLYYKKYWNSYDGAAKEMEFYKNKMHQEY